MSHQPGEEPIRPDPLTILRFKRLMESWRVDDAEVGFLLQADPNVWRRMRDGDPAASFDAEAQIRLKHCLDIAESVEFLAPGADQGDWLRTPHPILADRSPLYFMLRDDDALRSIRWTMLTETRPGFPGAGR